MKLSIVLLPKNYIKTALKKGLVYSGAGICIFLLLLSFDLRAAHIIGGEITYECLGWTNDDPSTNSRSYQFYMNIYRDCQGGGADFDSGPFGAFLATVSIYREDSTDEYLNLILDSPQVNFVEVDPNDPCVIVPSNVCVEQGVYTFPVIDLPVSEHSYFIAYQRCCRNNTITNIIDPANSGATYFMELTPAAQSTCNNSPVFNDFPPAVICSGQPLEFDHSASDAEGDQLVYEFCAPFLGGGNNNVPAENPMGLAPNPDAPPPYQEVNFVAPFYSTLDPLGTTADINIDPNTGIITGIPQALGQFVVGVCVKEFRNGELLSVVRRDFQFNVTNCDPTVQVQLSGIPQIDDSNFGVTRCGNPQITIINQSSQTFVDDFIWTFDLGGRDTTFSTWNINYEFPGPGIYEGQLQLNPGSECGDTAFVNVEIFPALNTDFEYEYDTCVSGPVMFRDLSSSEDPSVEITNWSWNFGNGFGSSNPTPDYEYEEPGNRIVQLRITDENGCQDSTTRLIQYFPVPALILVSPSAFEGCAPGEITFDNLSTPVNTDYQTLWDFGDGETSTDFSPSHVYTQEGIYDVALEIISPLGCQTDTVFNELIEIEPGPVAGFTYSPREPDIFNATIQFTDQSEGASRWFYSFSEDIYSTEQNPTYQFRDTGLQLVTLIVTHPSGCRDSISQIVDIVPVMTFYMPNAFTPNDDSINDVFMGKGYLEGYKAFSMSIFNRWGEEVFHTDSPLEAWNGRKFNTQAPVPDGTYFYLVQYTDPRGDEVELNGSATLIR
jgi:gliding motility-associated-like protein